MSKQTIDIGTAPNDGTGDTLRDVGDLVNDNFNELYTSLPIDVVRDYGADPTGSTDSTTAVQNALNAADDDPDGRPCDVIFPYGTYQITSTLTWPLKVNLIGRGTNATGSTPGPQLAWNGTDGGGPLIQTAVSGSNFIGRIENMGLYGKYATNTANDILVVKDRWDYPSGITNVQFNHAKRHALTFEKGCTNFSAITTRFDSIGGFCIVAEDSANTGAPMRNCNLIGGTYDTGVTGASGAGQGFMLFDYGNSTGSPEAFVTMIGWELEHNNTMEDWLPAQGTYDKAMICIGHNTDYDQNDNRVNVHLTMINVQFSGTSAGAASTACIKMGATTDHVSVVGTNTSWGYSGSFAARFDNTTTAFPGDTDGKYGCPHFIFAPSWQGSPGPGNLRNYYVGSCDFGSGRLILPGADLGEDKTGAVYFNDATDTLYIHNGTGWAAFSADA